eukprot:GSChrysophyteH2.ASY1.ANO1.1749.1 assembled CDS
MKRLKVPSEISSFQEQRGPESDIREPFPWPSEPPSVRPSHNHLGLEKKRRQSVACIMQNLFLAALLSCLLLITGGLASAVLLDPSASGGGGGGDGTLLLTDASSTRHAVQTQQEALALEYPSPLTSIMLEREVGKLPDPRSLERASTEHRSLRSAQEPDQAPLSWLMGSFFAYIYVGTPPQRVTVITDTGSHHTAFPCVGCACGKHMDRPFNPAASSTAEIKSCGGNGKKCYFQQAYSEGSSWHAYEVIDRVWVGEEAAPSSVSSVNERERASGNWSAPFKFGCQDKETGLFRTQEVDGIMGLSMHEQTLPYALHRQGVTKTKAFSLCIRKGGGVLTLGGVDPALNHGPLQWADLVLSGGGRASKKGSAWFTVRLVEILMKPVDGVAMPLAAGNQRYNQGKGTIVDSGTTDTYLPVSVTKQWNALFSKMSGGMTYNNKMQALSDEDFARLPSIVYRLQGLHGEGTINIESPPEAYTETVTLGNGHIRRTFRIYTTEGSGAVLGSNFMNGLNTIFDGDAKKIGFAKSDCHYSRDKTPAKIIRGDGTHIDQNMVASWEQPTYKQAEKEAAMHGAAGAVSSVKKGGGKIAMAGGIARAARSDPNIGLGLERLEDAPVRISYEYLEAGSFDKAMKLRFGSAGSSGSLAKNGHICGSSEHFELLSGCDATCNSQPGKTDTREAHTALGIEKWGYFNCNLSPNKYVSKAPRKCFVYCTPGLVAPGVTTLQRPTSDQQMVRGAGPQCVHEPWSDCNGSCLQERWAVGPAPAGQSLLSQTTTKVYHAYNWLLSVASTADTDVVQCERHLQTRTCRTLHCPTREGDYVVSGELRIRDMEHSVWSVTHSQELKDALALTLKYPESMISLINAKKLEGPNFGPGKDITMLMKIRVPSLQIADAKSTAERLIDALRQVGFPRFASLHASSFEEVPASSAPVEQNLATSVAGSWLTSEMLSLHGVTSVALTKGRASVKFGTAQHAVAGGMALSTAFMHPEDWTHATYAKVAVVLFLQMAVVGLFFLWRRVLAIRAEKSDTTTFNAFKGTKDSNDNDGDDAEGAASPAALSSRTRSAVDAAGSSSRRKGKSKVVQV